MIRLLAISEQNWQEAAKLSVDSEQKRFLDTAVGILARGYAYRSSRAKVLGIYRGETLVGLALVKDLEEEPACYDLQQFMIDRRYQGRGYGAQALELLLSALERERRFEQVEVCVSADNAPALGLFAKAGFADSGYVDPQVPHSRNLVYRFTDDAGFSEREIADFSDPAFQTAFRAYFDELGIAVADWNGLFAQMNDEGDNEALLAVRGDGQTIGFIQYRPIEFSSWFFSETCGLIREFWVSGPFRGFGIGSALLRHAEERFARQGVHTMILTTDSASGFYEKHGYVRAPGCRARNEDEVFVKKI